MESPATITSWNIWTDKELAPALPEAISQAAVQTPEIIPGVQQESTNREQATGGIGHIATQQIVSAENTGMPAAALDPEQSSSAASRPANLEDVITGEIAARPKTLADMPPQGAAAVRPELRIAPDPESRRINANDNTITLQAIRAEREKQGAVYGFTERYDYKGKHSQEKSTSVRNRRVALLAAATVTTAVLGGSMHTASNPSQDSKVEMLGNGNAAKDGIRMNTVTVTTGGEPILGVSPRQEKIINSIQDLDKAQRDALKRFTVGVHKVTKDLDGVNPNVMLAQAVHESNFGSTGSARVDKNLFGMKGSYEGKSGTWMTWEEYGGVVKRIRAKFKKYPDEAASMKDYIDQAHRLKRYYGDAVAAPTGKSYREDSDYLDHILDHDQPNEAAYATDSRYKGEILKTIKRLHIRELTKIDKTPIQQVEVAANSESTLPKVSKLTSIKEKIKAYALPKYYKIGSPGATEPTQAYKKAIEAVRGRDDEYIGDYDGIDCGVFVTRVMRDSGADPSYNDKGGNTYVQKQYLETHDDVKPTPGEQVLYHQVKNSEKLQPGDIAIKSDGPGTVGHTFFYVGNSLDTKNKDFKGVLASASFRNRAPMASNDYERSAYDWFRLIEK
jgi:flagellum-specific peptidoglycan hydrolase FlgJ